MTNTRWLLGGLNLFLALSFSACWSKPSETVLIRLDQHHYQLVRSSAEPLERLVRPHLTTAANDSLPSAMTYTRHLRSFDPAEPKAVYEDRHTFVLEEPLPVGCEIGVGTPEGQAFLAEVVKPASHPGIHIDRLGYQEGSLLVAKLGLYLGSKELPLPESGKVIIASADTGQDLEELVWERRVERGYPYDPNPNQEVATIVLPRLPQGRYVLRVPGWGSSEEFQVVPNAALESARKYAQGLYHQRCGVELTGQYTSWPREACHTGEVAGVGRAIVGGHHDAGDYGRYTYNSAQVAHLLLFSADHWFGLEKPDHLALPESGDGLSDLHQIALSELDFLLQMQREDGSFWGRLSPRDRAYESDLSAVRAGPQRIQEGSSAATAAAVAVLYQASRSDYLRETWPERARAYRSAAERGWTALESLNFKKANHHYGDVFEDVDERLWARLERSLASDEGLSGSLEGELRRWGWWPAFEGFGGAARAAAFSGSDGAPIKERLIGELNAASQAWLEAFRTSAYGVTFPLPSKRHQTAAWFFPHDFSYDLITSHILEPREEALEAIWANWSYERGVNPLNQVFLTGYGELSPRHILHQQAMNDEFELPPGGIPVGSLVTTIRFAGVPQGVDVPPFQSGVEGKPLDQRFADSPNISSEATVVNQARGLAVCAWLAANVSQEESSSLLSPVEPERP